MPPLAGLANVSSTCYINTCIQCLGYCDSFLQFILSKRDDRDDKREDRDDKREDNLVQELQEIYQQIAINKNIIAPYKFISSLKKNITLIDIHEQNDLGEFLVLYIDKLNQSIAYKLPELVLKYPKDPKNPKNLYKNNNNTMKEHWHRMNANEYSDLVPMFYGQLIAQIICGCKKIHYNYEMFSLLMVPLNNNNSLLECIDQYFNDENLSEWKCDHCNTIQKSEKTVRTWKNPEILMIGIKRFDANLRKNNRNIQIPLELDIFSYSLDNKSRYTLCSVGYHIGSYHGGHYVCIGRENRENYDKDLWYIADDDTVKRIENPNIEQGYLYFYQKI
jgi:ubiquitin C-terminal hydrolase